VKLATERYVEQRRRWPSAGRHILAHFDDETIVVYQAYSRAIGQFAVANGYFGGEFSYSRMSWVKPNFLWMMYRSDWGRSQGQEVVLGIRLRRAFFDGLLTQSVPSSFEASTFEEREDWKAAVSRSDVRLQWDPDHLPSGEACARRAIQLGLRGVTLAAYGRSEIIEVTDLSEFVAGQRDNLAGGAANLVMPVERTYLPTDGSIAARLELESQESK
jgi:uncharacterized protein DUF4291